MVDFRSKNTGQNGSGSADEAVTDDQLTVIRLVEKAAGGDVEAYGELYSIYLARIYRYVFHQVRDKMIAEDVTEEVFVKAWKAIDTCRGREKTFLPWLYRIAQNHVIDNLRKRKKQPSIEMEAVGEVGSPQPEVGEDLERQELLKVIAHLPQNQRQVIILKFIEGLDNPEIASIMGKSQGAVRVLQMRALARLRKYLGGGKQ